MEWWYRVVDIVLRSAASNDYEAAEMVEKQATPNLQYLPRMFSEFVNDPDGEFIVAEMDGKIVACGKFTVLPDSSAWLEALRVLPDYQGKGIGKAFYRKFFEIAAEKAIKTMRMYTGTRNLKSQGLAELNGFRVAGMYRGSSANPSGVPANYEIPDHDARAYASDQFRTVEDPKRATALLATLRNSWTGFFAMNRTFYEITPALCEYWTRKGMVYEDLETGSVVVAGARFMPETSLHLAAFAGDGPLCLAFAASIAASRGVNRIDCLFPPGRSDIQELLTAHGFKIDSDFIVMEVCL